MAKILKRTHSLTNSQTELRFSSIEDRNTVRSLQLKAFRGPSGYKKLKAAVSKMFAEMIPNRIRGPYRLSTTLDRPEAPTALFSEAMSDQEFARSFL